MQSNNPGTLFTSLVPCALKLVPAVFDENYEPDESAGLLEIYHHMLEFIMIIRFVNNGPPRAHANINT